MPNSCRNAWRNGLWLEPWRFGDIQHDLVREVSKPGHRLTRLVAGRTVYAVEHLESEQDLACCVPSATIIAMRSDTDDRPALRAGSGAV